MATRIHAPEVPQGLPWLGTPRPLRLAELKGQVVVLDFWTYCCVNCLHVLQVLAALEERRRNDPVVVIGVHSAKFPAEEDPERIREAMARHGVTHPVVVDVGRRIWQSYAIRSWPTLVVIRPDGSIAASAPGEADLAALDAFLQGVLDGARDDGTLAKAPLRVGELTEPSPGALAFPGKVIALPGGRLAVSDTGHHRVLVLDLDGRIEETVGSGRAGLEDGPAAQARFRSPQGLAFDPEAGVLFVADTGNHALREVDLERGRVRTAAGTGALGQAAPLGAVPARGMPLRSPWDLAVAGDYLLVAMAGAHQIWAYSRVDETIGVFAGTGREGLQDGTFGEAAFAQPSGLALRGSSLFVADSEASAVRCLDLAKGEVRTLTGAGLFDFGDADGPRESARLQHPLGIAMGPTGLLVADTYNHKLKLVDPETGAATTFFAAPGPLGLREPGGLALLEDARVVVADTNHHRLVVVERAGQGAEALPVQDAPVPEPPEGSSPEARTLRRVALGRGPVTLRLRLQPPEGFHLAEGSRVSIRVEAGPAYAVPQGDLGFEVAPGRRGVPVLLDPAGEPLGEGFFTLRVDAVLCGLGEGAACWPVETVVRVPFRADPSARPVADVSLPLRPPPVS